MADLEALLNSADDDGETSSTGGSIVEALLAAQTAEDESAAAVASASAPPRRATPTDEELLAELMADDLSDDGNDKEMHDYLSRITQNPQQQPPGRGAASGEGSGGPPPAFTTNSSTSSYSSSLSADSGPSASVSAAASASQVASAPPPLASSLVSPSARHAAAMVAEYTSGLAASGLGEQESEAALEALLASCGNEESEGEIISTVEEEEAKAHVLAEVEVELTLSSASEGGAGGSLGSHDALGAAKEAMMAAAAAGLPVNFPTALLQPTAAEAAAAPSAPGAALISPPRLPVPSSGSRARQQQQFTTPSGGATDAEMELDLEAIISAYSTPGLPPVGKQQQGASASPLSSSSSSSSSSSGGESASRTRASSELFGRSSSGPPGGGGQITTAEAVSLLEASSNALREAAQRENILLVSTGNMDRVSSLASRRNGRPRLTLSKQLELRDMHRKVSELVSRRLAVSSLGEAPVEALEQHEQQAGSARESMSEVWQSRSRASSCSTQGDLLDIEAGPRGSISAASGGGSGAGAAYSPESSPLQQQQQLPPPPGLSCGRSLMSAWAPGPQTLRPLRDAWTMAGGSRRPTGLRLRRPWYRPRCWPHLRGHQRMTWTPPPP